MTAVPDLTLPGLSLAFLAGLISFLSPCVLPLVPSYLGVIGGARAPLWRAAGFILGFGVVFIALGATASALGSLLAPHKILLGRVAGVLIVFFGLLMLGVFRLPLMMRDTRGMAGADRYGPVALGAAFAFGWSPCLGPVLGSILGLAASSASLGSGVGLLAVYTLGLAVPFLLAAVLWERLGLRRLNRFTPVFERVGGAVLVLVGLLMASGEFTRLAGYAYALLPSWLQL
ncbi:cytochrome c biogenesis CcdA family protein [Deinococcus aquiradiocola]|uniref:Cytochrome C biogenesis protein CcdA n=1 Tax=Deinococcus aquiradiocola TaxID=393059 RepID=A0A917PMR8_9DEIO|nr:cytochrome c biogenesis protein CcdA [Deinococcus aquiradiocola]GGJ85072.1 cytochrome C biogenesis protein CcdA [Deinococcus aquiradiocola]